MPLQWCETLEESTSVYLFALTSCKSCLMNVDDQAIRVTYRPRQVIIYRPDALMTLDKKDTAKLTDSLVEMNLSYSHELVEQIRVGIREVTLEDFGTRILRKSPVSIHSERETACRGVHEIQAVLMNAVFVEERSDKTNQVYLSELQRIAPGVILSNLVDKISRQIGDDVITR